MYGGLSDARCAELQVSPWGVGAGCVYGQKSEPQPQARWPEDGRDLWQVFMGQEVSSSRLFLGHFWEVGPFSGKWVAEFLSLLFDSACVSEPLCHTPSSSTLDLNPFRLRRPALAPQVGVNQ